jgi:tetratricopeptide (TPR) repeat protein
MWEKLLRFGALLVIVVLTTTARAIATPPQDEESLARQAEQAGRLREALTHYVTALQTATEGSDADQRLREKIIAVVLTLRPPPAKPEEVENFMGRGRAAVEIAKTPDDFRRAAAEFQKALMVAPWLPNGYFNLGVVQDRAGQYSDAIRSFKLYLLAAPAAADASEVRERIAGLEYKIERQQLDAQAAARKVQNEQEHQRNAEQERQREREKFQTIYNSLPGT